MLGTLAGDDTILVVCEDARIARRFTSWLTEAAQ